MGPFSYYLANHVTAALPRLGARIHRSGFEHVPRTGPALLLANHISHFDPPLMALKFPRHVHYMADKPLMEIPVLGELLRRGYVFPIDRTKTDRAALRTAMERLKAGNVVGIFPEGGIRHGKTAAVNGAEMPVGTASLWRMMDVPVIPMAVIGTDQLYSLRYYPWRARVFIRVGPVLPPDAKATREELRDRIVAAWRGLYEGMIRDYAIRPDELPQSAQQRWGKEPKPNSQIFPN
ncbi:MAG: lysophospholipid acyltransferase family protein [Verrucomicrobiota bacterium]